MHYSDPQFFLLLIQFYTSVDLLGTLSDPGNPIWYVPSLLPLILLHVLSFQSSLFLYPYDANLCSVLSLTLWNIVLPRCFLVVCLWNSALSILSYLFRQCFPVSTALCFPICHFLPILSLLYCPALTLCILFWISCSAPPHLFCLSSSFFNTTPSVSPGIIFCILFLNFEL